MRNKARSRNGLAAVEAALVMPIVVLITLCAIDVAQYINLAQLVSNASREGARCACLGGTANVSEVESAVEEYLLETLPQLDSDSIGDAVEIVIRDAGGCQITNGDMSCIETGEMFTVSIEFDFSTVRWLPGLDYWEGGMNTSTSIGRRE